MKARTQARTHTHVVDLVLVAPFLPTLLGHFFPSRSTNLTPTYSRTMMTSEIYLGTIAAGVAS